MAGAFLFCAKGTRMNEIGPEQAEGPPGFTTAEKVVLWVVGGAMALGLFGYLFVMSWVNSLQGHNL